MNKEYFYLKEILLGLRKSYISNRVKLDLLKEYISYNKLKYRDVFFNVDSENGIKNVIICNYSLLKIPNTNSFISSKVISENNNYKIENMDKEISIIDNEKFNLLANYILDDKIIKSTRYTSFIEKDADGNKIYANIMFDPTGIYASPHFKSVITYIPKEDIIRIDKEDNDEKFGINLDTKVPSEIIPISLLNMLDESNIKQSDIKIIGDVRENKITDYEIEEKNNKILLIRRY